MAIKLDLEKAYDRLSWDFIQDTLIDVGMPNMFINLIMDCISSANMSILWNGGQTVTFKSTGGIRQGDPISPYIFVLCMERLSQLINLTVDCELWKPIKLARNGPHLSHLCFVDDIILFAKATSDQVLVIKGILDLFSRSSG